MVKITKVKTVDGYVWKVVSDTGSLLGFFDTKSAADKFAKIHAARGPR